MKLSYVVILIFIFTFQLFSDNNLDFKSVLINAEQNPSLTQQAVKLAAERNLPTSIYIENKAFISPIIVDNGQVIYSVITNLAHPFNGGYLTTFDQLNTQFDLGSATIRYYGEKGIQNHSKAKLAVGDSLYLIPESTNDNIMAFDANTGDLIDAAYILPQGAFSTPIEAMYHNIRNSFVVSDQLEDLVQEFDTAGVFLGTFVPKGGQAVDTLDNVRGIGFHPNGNLLVTTAGGANSDAIVEFDADGNFVQNFIAPNASIMDSPFDVLTRAGDILIPALTNEVIARYDFSGTYLDYFTTGIDFPEQLAELASGEIAAANFGANFSGVQIFPPSGGSYTQLLNGVTGVRGVAELANGNILTTNGGGVHELDRSTGALVRTIQAGVSARFIGFYIVGQPSVPQTARVQVIHNSADTAAAVVDVWLNDALLLNDFAFRTAWPFIDAPAGVDFDITVAPSNSADTTSGLWRQTYQLADGETYVLIADGIVSSSGYTPATPFDIFVYGMGREVADTTGNTDVLVFHGATDAPTVDVVEVGVGAGTIVDDISFGEYQGYLELGTADYRLDVRDSTGMAIVATYEAPLATLGLQDSAIVVFASGFLTPANNSNGPVFGLWAALANGAVVELPEFINSISENENAVPKEFALHQNYPNPFNPQTTIQFDLPKNSDVKLKVYNIQGEFISSLVNNTLPAGKHKVVWDATDFGSGVYYLVLEANNLERQTRKMILIK